MRFSDHLKIIAVAICAGAIGAGLSFAIKPAAGMSILAILIGGGLAVLVTALNANVVMANASAREERRAHSPIMRRGLFLQRIGMVGLVLAIGIWLPVGWWESIPGFFLTLWDWFTAVWSGRL